MVDENEWTQASDVPVALRLSIDDVTVDFSHTREGVTGAVGNF